MRRLRSEIGLGRWIKERADGRLEHQIELTRVGQIAVGVFSRPFARLARTLAVLDLVGAEAPLTRSTVDEQIIEEVEVPARLPDLRVHDDRRIEADHIEGCWCVQRRCGFIVAGDHVPPPGLLDVSLQLDTEGTVVPETADSAVDLARLENETPSFAEGDDSFHGRVVVVHGVLLVSRDLRPTSALGAALSEDYTEDPGLAETLSVGVSHAAERKGVAARLPAKRQLHRDAVDVHRWWVLCGRGWPPTRIWTASESAPAAGRTSRP